MDCNPLDSSVYGNLQARILVWVAILFSRDLPHPGIQPGSPVLQVNSLVSEPTVKPIFSWKGKIYSKIFISNKSRVSSTRLYINWKSLSYMHACLLSHFNHTQFCATLRTAACQASLSMRFSRHNAGVHCHALLQGIFLTQGWNLHWHVGSLPLVPPGKPIIYEFCVKTE